jgi:glycosyltransferase involved in cell wall biosynthesis
MTQLKVALSFVIPAYNEEDFIEDALGMLDKVVKNKELPYEIIVVNDGSKDKTLPKAITYASRNGHVKVVSYSPNEGKGYAIKKGFMHTSGEVVVFVDSDMEIDFSLISSYVEALQHGDIVIASKWHPQSVVEIPLARRFLSYGFNVLVRLLTGVTLRDTQAGLKAIKRSAFMDVFQRLAVKRYAFDVELLAVANLYGLKVVEMPVKLKMGASFRLREMWRMLIDLLGIAYRLKLIHWYQRPNPSRNGLQNMISFVLREKACEA